MLTKELEIELSKKLKPIIELAYGRYLEIAKENQKRGLRGGTATPEQWEDIMDLCIQHFCAAYESNSILLKNILEKVVTHKFNLEFNTLFEIINTLHVGAIVRLYQDAIEVDLLPENDRYDRLHYAYHKYINKVESAGVAHLGNLSGEKSLSKMSGHDPITDEDIKTVESELQSAIDETNSINNIDELKALKRVTQATQEKLSSQLEVYKIHVAKHDNPEDKQRIDKLSVGVTHMDKLIAAIDSRITELSRA